MPYIKKELRPDIDVLVEKLSDLITLRLERDYVSRAGQLNYAVTRLLQEVYTKARYDDYNEAIGVLECVKAELYSRAVVGYEAKKERENGDVYSTDASSTNIAWAGGFFEGEGCFYAHYGAPREDGSKVYRTHASLCQKSEHLLIEFKNVVKCGSVYKDNDIYVWKTNRVGEAEKVFNLLRPYLGERRQRRFLELHSGETAQVFNPPKPPRTHCKKNHDLSIVGRRPDGTCAECDRKYKRDWYHKKQTNQKADDHA